MADPLQVPWSQQLSHILVSLTDSVPLKVRYRPTGQPASWRILTRYPRAFRGRPRRRGPLAQ